MRTFLLILCLLVLVPIMALFFMSATPVVTLPPSLTALGQSTPITINVSDSHGIRSAIATVEQNGSSYKVWEMAQPSHRLRWKGGVADAVYTFLLEATPEPFTAATGSPVNPIAVK